MLLTSDDTPLPSGKITMDEFSSVAAFSLFGGMMGNIFFGFFDFGRKIPLLLMAIPIIVSCSTHSNKSQNDCCFYQIKMIEFIIADRLAADFICSKPLLLVRSKNSHWICWRRCFYIDSIVFVRNCKRSVNFWF